VVVIMLPPIEHSIDQHGPIDWGHAVTQAGIVGLGTGGVMAVRGIGNSLALAAAMIGAIAAFGSFVLRDLFRSHQPRASRH
jgi:hypothetical protein